MYLFIYSYIFAYLFTIYGEYLIFTIYVLLCILMVVLKNFINRYFYYIVYVIS